MYKKTLYFLSLITFSIHAFASGVTEEISFNAPHRMGYRGEIQTLKFSNIKKGPADSHFSLKADEQIGDVMLGHMRFDTTSVYGHDNLSQRFVAFDSDTQKLVKNRISTFAIARLTHYSFQKCCEELPNSLKKEALQNLNTVKVTLNPNDQICRIGKKNAYYQRTANGGQGEIDFCNISLSTASFFDVPAHETGHAILDALRPLFNNGGEYHPYSALHEAFGDLSAIFASARLTSLQSRGAHLANFLRSDECLCIAKGWSGPSSCLRSCQDQAEGSCEAHDKSIAFTRFFGKAMKYTFDDLRPTIQNAEWVFNYFQKLLVATVLRISAAEFNSLHNFGSKMGEMAEWIFSDYESKLELLPIITKSIQKALSENSSALKSCSDTEPSLLRAQSIRAPWGEIYMGAPQYRPSYGYHY